MNLTTLTHRDALCLNARFTSREEAIHALTQRLAALGKISSTEQFLEEVYRRESLGPTALGEGLAVPHGKTAAVKEAAFAVATLSEPLQWEGVDGPEAVDLVVLLAIPPNEAGTTHMQLLTALTTRLADDEIRARIQSATTPDELLSALDDKGGTQPSASFSNAPTIVCVTACPAGIAHTYMAAEYLEKAGRKLGVNVYVEKQGANGIEGRLTADQLNSATACIFAAEVAIKESERFNGIPALSVPVAEPIRHAEALIQQALTLKRSDETRTVQQDTQPVKSVKTELKQALLSGISFAVPLIVAGGTVLAVAVLLSQIFGLQDLFNEENSWLWMYRKLGGVVVVASEGLHDDEGKPIVPPIFQTGRSTYFGDVSSHLAQLVVRRLGIKARSEKPGILARASIAWQSPVDAAEAEEAGRAACRAVLAGETGQMVAFRRVSSAPYRCETFLVPIEEVMLGERVLPAEYLTAGGTDVTEAFCGWCRPLLGPELPSMARLF